MHGSSTRFPQLVTVLLFAVVTAGLSAGAEENSATLLFRIFLKGGGMLVSYGEYARVADRVVFAVPLGNIHGDPKLQMVGIPESAVDWEQTDRYASAVRAKRYADTRGESDYALLTAQVTMALNDLAGETNPARRLAMAEEARRKLAEWPAANYGYRVAEVARLISLFDDAIAELRVAAGQKSFDLSLVAMTMPPPADALLPVPDSQATVEMAFTAATLSSDPAERTALLARLAADLEHEPSVTWVIEARTRIAAVLATESRLDKAYAELTNESLKAAAARTERADVNGLQNIIARALKSDEALGRKRPGEMASLLASLDSRLNDARRVRLGRDAGMLRVEVLKNYQAEVAEPLRRLGNSRRWLSAIRNLSGPDPRSLKPLEDRVTIADLQMQRVTPPAEARTVHGLIAAAIHMARQAASLRRNAVLSNDIKIAWDASAAAAGAISLADRAVDELQRLISSRPR